MPVGQFGSLNFAILVTCGHSFIEIIRIHEIMENLPNGKTYP